MKIFVPDADEILKSGDAVQDKGDRARFLQKAKLSLRDNQSWEAKPRDPARRRRRLSIPHTSREDRWPLAFRYAGRKN